MSQRLSISLFFVRLLACEDAIKKGLEAPLPTHVFSLVE